MILLLLLIGFILFLFHQFYWRRRNSPPGPIPLPFVGNMIEIYKHQPGYDAYMNWAKQYGPVYTYFLGTIKIVAITDYDIMKKYIINEGDKFTDRYHIQVFTDMFRGGNYGIVDTDGQLWRDQRRFAIATLRDFGMGKNGMEERVLAEVDYMFEKIEKNGGTVEISKIIQPAVGNIINGVIFGYRFDEGNDEIFWKIRNFITKQQSEFFTFGALLLLTIPQLRHLPYFGGIWQKLKSYRDVLFGFFDDQIEKTKAKIDFDSPDSDTLAEVYLKEQKKREHEPDFGGFSNIQLQNVVVDLWLAGLETTANTLTWCFILMANYPKVVDEMHEELDKVVGPNEKVTLANKNRLPYCNAVIMEVQRFVNLIPQNLFRVTTEDVNVEGHFLKKGTTVIPQISCVLFDEKIFFNAREFIPSRFINEDGSLKKAPELIPFSIGKRQCAGEGLARLELFHFFVNIIHKYDLHFATVTPIERSFKTIAQVPSIECTFKERF